MQTIGNIPRLTKEQNRVLGLLLEGAEIQMDYHQEKWCYSIILENGDSETCRSDTFEKLKKCGLIKYRYSPALDVERWS